MSEQTDENTEPRSDGHERRSQPIARVLSSASVAAAGATIVGTLAASLSLFVESSQQRQEAVIEERVTATRAELWEVRERVKDVEAQIASLQDISPEQQISSELVKIRERISKAERTYETIEKAIVDNPERAMSLPILRRDVDAIKSEIRKLHERKLIEFTT